MDKLEAIELLGGTASAAAQAVGVTVQAVQQWPAKLPARIADRVQAALWRKSRLLHASEAAPAAPQPTGAAHAVRVA
jgi:hypothetical protein